MTRLTTRSAISSRPVASSGWRRRRSCRRPRLESSGSSGRSTRRGRRQRRAGAPGRLRGEPRRPARSIGAAGAALPAPRGDRGLRTRRRPDAPVRLVDSPRPSPGRCVRRRRERCSGRRDWPGVERVLVPAWNPASSAAPRRSSRGSAWLDAAAGVHPHDASKADDAGWARSGARREPGSSDGETGSTTTASRPIDDQLANLPPPRARAETGKPSILHCRSAAGERDAQDELDRGAPGGRVEGAARRASASRRRSCSTRSRPGRLREADSSWARGELLGARLPGAERRPARRLLPVPPGPPPCRDRFAVPQAARRPAVAQRAGVGRG